MYIKRVLKNYKTSHMFFCYIIEKNALLDQIVTITTHKNLLLKVIQQNKNNFTIKPIL